MKSLRFKEGDEKLFIDRVICGMKSSNMVIQPIPGHLVLMGILYYFSIKNNERLKSLLDGIVKEIKEIIYDENCPLEELVFWVSNTFHLLTW